MTENVETAADHIATDLTALRQDVTRMAEAMNTLLKHQTKAVGSRVSEIAGDANDQIGRTVGQAQSQVYAAEAGIKRNAVTATLISFGIGISIGLLSRLRA